MQYYNVSVCTGKRVFNLKKALKEKLKKIWRKPLVNYMTKKTGDKRIRILATNCMGGILYHDTGKPFDSPTINCTVSGMDFIKLCENPDYYMIQIPTLHSISPQGYPIADVGGIKVNGVHYKDIDDFSDKWLRRGARFLEQKDAEILVIASDAQIKTDEEVEAFHKLPYRKVCFTIREDIPYEEFIIVNAFKGKDAMGDLTRYAGLLGKRIFENEFDFVKWINNKM